MTTRAELLALHADYLQRMGEICKAKNADYAGTREGKDAFANFRAVEHLGICPVETGLLTRMTDKLARVTSICATGKVHVDTESVEDTLLDLANYALLMAAYLATRPKPAARR